MKLNVKIIIRNMVILFSVCFVAFFWGGGGGGI